jgi:hypothetical protein
MKITESVRHARAAAKRQDDSERQREHDADRRDHDRHQHAAPQHRVDRLKANPRPTCQQDVGHDRQHDEEINGAEVAARRFQPQQPDHPDGQHEKEHIDAPALRNGVRAVDEIRQSLPDERPTGADLAVLDRPKTGIAVVSAPHRVDHKKPHDFGDRPGEQQHDQHRERDIERRGQEVCAQPADRARHRRRRRPRLNRRAAHKGHFSNGKIALGHGHGLRLTVPPAPCGDCRNS